LQNVINFNTANFVCESNIIFGGGDTEPANVNSANNDIRGTGYNATVSWNYFYNRITTTQPACAWLLGSAAPGVILAFSNIFVAPIPLYTADEGNIGTLFLTNNIFYASSSNFTAPVVDWVETNNVGITVDYNDYFAVPNGGGPAFMYDYVYHLTLSQWQTNTGFDLHSTIGSDGQEPPNVINVMPNQDVGKRCNIVIYNWSLQNNVSVSLANILNSGDSYKLYSAQNYNAGPIQSGTFNGTNISVPMTNLTVAPILYGTNMSSDEALIAQPPPTSPEFGAFVVIGAAGTNTPPVPPTNLHIVN
jgi:hypothetical protein